MIFQQIWGQIIYIFKKTKSDTLLHTLNKVKFISFTLSKFLKCAHKEKSQSWKVNESLKVNIFKIYKSFNIKKSSREKIGKAYNYAK